MKQQAMINTADALSVPQLSAAFQTCRLLDKGQTRTALDYAHRAAMHAQRVQVAAVRAARAEGMTWAQIGFQLGMTKQGAHQRFSPLMDEAGQ